MKRRFLLTFMVFSIIFSSLYNPVYAVESIIKPDYQPIKVKLNDKFLEFDVEPIIYNDRTMVPMRAIFEYLGSLVKWYGDTKTVTGYKDNMFIKLQIGNTTAYKNGKSFTLDAEPIIRNSRTLVPVRFIAESFGIVVDWDDENKIVSLNYDKDIDSFRIIDDMLYKSVDFKEHGIKFMIPDYFENPSETPYDFKYEDEESNIHMNLEFIKLDKTTSLDSFIENHKASILEKYNNKIIFTGKDNFSVNSLDINSVYLKNYSYSPEINQAIFYVYNNDIVYLFTFSYYSSTNDSQLLNVFYNIINTIEVSNLSIDLKDEHYIEYDEFFNLDVKLDNEIYSNMEVQNKFNFKGTINNDDLDYLFVVVRKETDSIEFKVPVEEKQFDTTIYTPFGLGKHNIDVGTPLDENNTSRYIMQFSVVNLSSDDIRYLIPSRFVEKDDDITMFANEITKDALSNYDKAASIFKWISENIEYDPKASIQIPRSAKETLNDKKGDCDEISYLYAALLRSLNIPTKLVSGKIDEAYHVWNEVKINGKWIIVDSTWGSGYFIDDTTYIKKLDMDFFNIDREKYESQFTDIEYLPY